MSEALKAEQAAERERRRRLIAERTLATAVGDFDRILQLIGGHLHMLGRELPAGESARRRLDNAEEGVRRGARLAARLQALAPRAGAAAEVVDVGAIVRVLEPALVEAAGEATALKVAVEAGLWSVRVDPPAFETALLNLVLNAGQAMPAGGRLRIVAANLRVDRPSGAHGPHLPLGDYVVVSVADNGEGMEPEVFARACEPFFTTRPPGEGAGLGLAIVRAFVEGAGGQLGIESDQGVTVRLYLPRAPG
jgi:signal transduction histidine kinase